MCPQLSSSLIIKYRTKLYIMFPRDTTHHFFSSLLFTSLLSLLFFSHSLFLFPLSPLIDAHANLFSFETLQSTHSSFRTSLTSLECVLQFAYTVYSVLSAQFSGSVPAEFRVETKHLTSRQSRNMCSLNINYHRLSTYAAVCSVQCTRDTWTGLDWTVCV